MKVRFLLVTLVLTIAASTSLFAAPRSIGINVLLNTSVTDAVVADLSKYGRVGNKLLSIDAVTMSIEESQLEVIRALPYVAAANPDAERLGAPVDTVSATNFANGFNTWDNDAINVTQIGTLTRQVPFDGSGVYVAVLDTGLLDNWRRYFPQERIATQFAKAFNGGGGFNGVVSEPNNKWEHDQNSHGTHVTSTVLGYAFGVNPINGVAPRATVIPVKVLNQNGSGWSSVIARGIEYVADLKNTGALGGAPVVINMSLGGSVLDAVEQAAIDYAVASGVIIVASAGNRGAAGMGFPGAYPPVISVAAAGWIGQWPAGNNSWWNNRDVPESAGAEQFYIADFSSRQLSGQDLDVVGPGAWVVGPYQLNSSNQISYFFLSGTSMSAPHVAGIAALMMQKNPTLTQGMVETLLEGAAKPMGAGCATVNNPGGTTSSMACWGADATGAGFITADAALAVTP